MNFIESILCFIVCLFIIIFFRGYMLGSQDFDAKVSQSIHVYKKGDVNCYIYEGVFFTHPITCLKNEAKRD